MVCSIFTKRYKVAKQNICLKLNNDELMKAHHPTHLGFKIDRQFTFNKYTQGSITLGLRDQRKKCICEDVHLAPPRLLAWPTVCAKRSNVELTETAASDCSASQLADWLYN